MSACRQSRPALVLAYLLKRYGDDGYRGAPYRRVLRGTRMTDPHDLKRLVRAANRCTNARQGTAIAPVSTASGRCRSTWRTGGYSSAARSAPARAWPSRA